MNIYYIFYASHFITPLVCYGSDYFSQTFLKLVVEVSCDAFICRSECIEKVIMKLWRLLYEAETDSNGLNLQSLDVAIKLCRKYSWGRGRPRSTLWPYHYVGALGYFAAH